MPATWSSLARPAAVLCAAVLLAACGTESGDDAGPDSASDPTSSATPSPSTSTSPDASGLPACADVWVDGQELPADYQACTQDGETVKPVKKMCGFGAPLLEQEGRFYAMKGNIINDVGDLATSDEYQQLLASCQG